MCLCHCGTFMLIGVISEPAPAFLHCLYQPTLNVAEDIKISVSDFGDCVLLCVLLL